MTVTLCVLLWAADGRAADLAAYEGDVLRLLDDHGGAVLQRVCRAEPGDEPDEVQLIRFSSEAALEGFMADPRRTAMAARRDACIARTDAWRVDPV